MHYFLHINIALRTLVLIYAEKRADTLAHLLPLIKNASPVSQWKYLDLECLQPLDWGWKLENNAMDPVKADLDLASESILQSVRCKCKPTIKNP